jgi:hypothetical protein
MKHRSLINTQHSALSTYFIIWLVAGLLTAAIVLLSWPTRTITQTAASAPDREGNLGFSGQETHPTGYRFAWALSDSALLYTDAPRYSPLNLTLRLNLDRPAGTPPAVIEVYERPAVPTEDEASGAVEGTEKLVATLRYDPARPGPQDYYLTLPPRERGDGAYISFKTNTFQVGSDRRQLAFMFIRAELQMPKSHLRYLFWPHFYFPAAFIFLAAALAWCRLVTLGWGSTLALSGMLAYALMMSAQSTWRITWLMLLLALGLWACYFWFGWATRKSHQPSAVSHHLSASSRNPTDHESESQPSSPNTESSALSPQPSAPKFHPSSFILHPSSFIACACVIALFLLTNDNLKGDTVYYINWSHTIHEHGIWNAYAYDSSLNYLPLVTYLLWFYNWIVYPFGWQDSILAWRIFASALYMALLYVLYRITKLSAISRQPSAIGPESSALSTHFSSFILHPSSFILHPSPYWLVLVGFNVSLFYNPTLWGQSDIIAALPLAIAFYLILRCQVSGIRYQVSGGSNDPAEQSTIYNLQSTIPKVHPSSFILHPLLAGLALGMVAISKPQAWFVLPLGILLLLKVAGWRRGLLGLTFGGIIALGLSVIAFGFDPNSFNRYWNQGQLAGEYRYDFPAAYNFDYLILGLRTEVPTWLSILGFGAVALVGILIAWRTLRGATNPASSMLGAALLNTTCFTFLIKMKERYLIYAMPLLGLGTHYDRKLIGPFLTLSWLQLINLSIIMFQSGRSRLQTLPENFYLWGNLLSQNWLRQGVALGFILTLLYMVAYYWRSTTSK